MTYVTEQTSAELRAHMRRLQAIPGWHNPLDDRLFKEIQALDAEITALRSTLPPTAITAEEAGREGEAVQLREVHRLLTNAIPFRLGLIERSSSRAEAEVNCERIREMLATVLAELPPAQGGQE